MDTDKRVPFQKQVYSPDIGIDTLPRYPSRPIKNCARKEQSVAISNKLSQVANQLVNIEYVKIHFALIIHSVKTGSG